MTYGDLSDMIKGAQANIFPWANILLLDDITTVHYYYCQIATLH